MFVFVLGCYCCLCFYPVFGFPFCSPLVETGGKVAFKVYPVYLGDARAKQFTRFSFIASSSLFREVHVHHIARAHACMYRG